MRTNPTRTAGRCQRCRFWQCILGFLRCWERASEGECEYVCKRKGLLQGQGTIAVFLGIKGLVPDTEQVCARAVCVRNRDVLHAPFLAFLVADAHDHHDMRAWHMRRTCAIAVQAVSGTRTAAYGMRNPTLSLRQPSERLS